jgi:hypothetical protein
MWICSRLLFVLNRRCSAKFRWISARSSARSSVSARSGMSAARGQRSSRAWTQSRTGKVSWVNVHPINVGKKQLTIDDTIFRTWNPRVIVNRWCNSGPNRSWGIILLLNSAYMNSVPRSNILINQCYERWWFSQSRFLNNSRMRLILPEGKGQ